MGITLAAKDYIVYLLYDNGSVRGSSNGTIGNFTKGTIGSQWYHWLASGTIGFPMVPIVPLALPLVKMVLPMIPFVKP